MEFLSQLFTKPSLVFDTICVLLLLLLALRYAHKGLVATLVEMVGTLASLIGGRWFAAKASPWVFENLLAQGLTEKITDVIAEGGTVDLYALVDKFAGFLPESFRTSVVESFTGSISGALSSTAAQLATQVVGQVIEPLITPIISIVLFFVAFALCRMLISFAVTVLANINRIPVIGDVNRSMGFVVGLIAGLVDLFFVLCVVWALIVITGGTLPFLSEAALADSLFYRAFGLLNPFV